MATPRTTNTWKQIPATVWVLGFVSLLMDVSSEIIHALLPVYLVIGLGASVLTVGIIEGVAEATASITKVFSGAISDWLGRRKFLVALGYGLAALTKPIFPLAPSVSWLIAARFIDRVGKGIRGAPRDALIADVSPPHLRGASFGLRQSLDTVGAFLGPLLAILLMWLTLDNFIIVFWCAVLPAALAFFLILFAVREPEHHASTKPSQSSPKLLQLKRLGRKFWWVVVIGAVFSLARFSEAFLILKANAVGLPLFLVPAVLVLMNLIYAFAAYPAGILSDKTDRLNVPLAGLAVLIVADLVLCFASNLFATSLGIVLWGLHMGLTQGILATLVADVAPANLRGTAFGLFNLALGLAALMASVIAGGLWELAGSQATFLAGAAFALLAFTGIFLFQNVLQGASKR